MSERDERIERDAGKQPDDQTRRKESDERKERGTWIALGMSIGAGVGVAFGSIPIGVGAGLAIGLAIARSKRRPGD